MNIANINYAIDHHKRLSRRCNMAVVKLRRKLDEAVTERDRESLEQTISLRIEEAEIHNAMKRAIRAVRTENNKLKERVKVLEAANRRRAQSTRDFLGSLQ